MGTKRIGLSLVGDHTCRNLLRYVRLAEGHGYESVWLPEDLGMRDAIAPLAMFATSTKRIGLAPGILPIHYRPAALTAMTFATLDEISNGRMILALGHGLLPWLTQLGIRIERPIEAMKEYTQMLRQLWSGETVNHNGTIYTVDNVKLSFKQTRPKIPIYLAARGPRMFQLAGEIADGVLNNEGLVTPQYFEWVRTNLAKGAERAGRKASEVDLAAYLFVSIADEHDEAKERIKPSIVGMLAQGALTPHLERLGTSLAEMTPLLNACKEGDTRGACKLVTDKILQATCVYGTPSECKRQMRSFRNAGVKLPIILPVGDWTKTIRLAKDW